ncbi:MAG: IclR family transcriptional regulator [Steroidobacteraceae bacterium]
MSTTAVPGIETPAKNRKAKIQVIARAASVLRTLEHEPDGLSLGVISQRLKLPRSTVQRIVGALEAENLLIPVSPNGRVKLGPAILRLSASVETSTNAYAKPYMIELARDLGETVDLSMLGRHHAVLIEQASAAPRAPGTINLADNSPLHCTASGKALLAQLTDTEVEQKIGRSYPARTEQTHTGLNDLLVELQEIRRTGLAYDLEEHTPGMCAVGVGFRDALGNRLALSVSLPSSRHAELSSKIAARLLALRDLLATHFRSG